MKRKFIFKLLVVLLVFWAILSLPLAGKPGTVDNTDNDIDREVRKLMEDGDIPGLSLVIVKADGQVVMKGYGYADLAQKTPVGPDTMFELASCSKAFTALAALRCEQQGLLKIDDPVSLYIPGFHGIFNHKKYDITLRQLLHQTSGIPFASISLIPRGSGPDALQQTARKLSGIELTGVPGSQFEYATINYDVIGAIIEKVSGLSFEEYMSKNILLPLGMSETKVGVDQANPPAHMATGYKIGFFRPLKYIPPVFRGNNPAGYFVSNARDTGQWLKAQMGLLESEMNPLIERTHQADQSVPLNLANLSNYGMGWFVYLERFKRIDHHGDNPNFTSFITFNPKDKIGVAVLANSNSKHTSFIGNTVMNYLHGKGFFKPAVQADNTDKGASVTSIMVAFFLLFVIAYIVSMLVDIFRGRRKFAPLTLKNTGKLLMALVFYAPFVYGVMLSPRTLAGVSMETALVFSAISFQLAITLILVTLGICYLAMLMSTLFPHQNKYHRSLPFIMVLSLMAGGANAIVIFLITTSVFNRSGLFYQVYNFALAFFVYIIGRKVLQTRLTRITFDIVFDMRMRLLEKISYTSYQKFEKIDRGRVFATINNDTGQIGGTANIVVQLITSAITTIGAFFYLATIAFWATMLTLGVVGVIATLYLFVTRRTRVYFEDARETQNVFMRLLNGLIDGFKELSLQYNKKKDFIKELEETTDEFRQKTAFALIKFVNAFLIGESLLIIILGSVGYGIPRLFPQVTPMTLMGFIMVLLYLIGPINGILNSIPAIMQLKVAWGRVQGFIKDIPANMDPKDIDALDHNKPGPVDSIKATGITFTYESANENEKFTVGPIDFEARKGEIVFIVGGNGSGKTTLAKLLTGLYQPDQGQIKVNDEEISTYRLGEYFSVVFGDYHLFEKMYNVNLEGREEEIEHYLKLLKLQEKVSLQGNSFSTIGLSGGQRKRLALLQCYLEDCPIYLFDEIAADQDPGFRKFFYRELLSRMKEKGKIVIAITHDDHYFDVADRIVKMDMGKLDILEDGAMYRVTL